MKLSSAFSRLEPFRVLVLGDFMLDTYTMGRVKRISPEAPVPVMEVLSQESRPGGAGNVVLNLSVLGGQVIAVGRIGADAHGAELKERLLSARVDCSALYEQSPYRTPLKNRLIAESQQLLRVDMEDLLPLPPSLEEQVISSLEQLIPQVQVVALSDYGKGFLTRPVIRAAIRIARASQIPVIVDPKGSDFTKYSGATVLKPNLSEAHAAVKMPSSIPLSEVAREIFAQVEIDLLLVTRSEAGITLFDQQGRRSDFPVRSREVKDVTGAGDTVLAILCLALANQIDIATAVQFANIAAGIAIERVGCVQVTLSEFAQRLLEIDSDTKIFDESHTFALTQVLQNKKYSLLILRGEQEMSNALFHSIRQIATGSEEEWIVYVEDGHPDDALVHLLASLNEVDYIILQQSTLQHLCEAICPNQVLSFEHGKMVRSDSWITPPPRQRSFS